MPQIIPPDDSVQYDQFGRPVRLSQPPPAPVGPAVPIYNPAATTPQPELPSINVTPVNPMPHEQQLESLPPIPDPNDPRYHQSRLRTVLNAIASGFAGASGGPKAGLETAESLRNSAYNRDVQRAETQRKLIKPQVESEVERRRAGEEQIRLQTGQETAKSLASQRKEKEQIELEKNRQNQEKINLAHQKQNSLEQYRKDEQQLKKYVADKKTDPIAIANWLDASDIADPEEKEIVKKRRQELWREEKAGVRQTPEEAKALTTAREEAKVDVALSPKGKEAAAVTSGARAGAAETARRESQASIVTSQLEERYNSLVKTDPSTALQLIKDLPAGAKAKLLASSIPKKLPARSEERINNAKITLNHVDSAIKLATDPDIAKNLGPIAGRIELIKGKIGTGEPTYIDYDKAIANLAPDQARKMGEFLNFLNYMIVWESTTLSGTRPAQRLIEQLITTGARASMSQDRLLGALDAVKLSVNNTIGAILPGSTSTEKKKGGNIDFSRVKIVP